MILDEYAREKVTRTLGDLEHAAAVLRNFLTYADYCDEKGIQASDELFAHVRDEMETIRRTGAPGDPVGDIRKVGGIFERGQTLAHAMLSPTQQREVLDAIKTGK